MKLAKTHRPFAASSVGYDAIIVGAGPAGSTLATSLAEQGWHVLVVERDSLPRHKVCGEFLSPEAQKTLRALGLYEVITALDPVPLYDAKLVAQSGRTLEINLPGVAWGISRYALDAALAAAAEQRGAELWSGATVTGYQQSDEKVVVELRRRQAVVQTKPDENETSTVQTRAVIMACGRHTWAALLPGIRGQRTHSQARNLAVGIKSHFTNLSMPDQVELYLFEGGYIGINRVENDCVNVCALASYNSFARAGRSPSAMIQAAAQWNPAFGQRLRDAQAVPNTECSVAGVDTRRAAMPWANLPLVGDTAAMIAPLCGDGMAMALRSAEVCGALVDSYLRGAFSWHELGRRYNRLWHQEFDHRLRLGRLLEKILQRPLTADLLFRTGATLPFLANYLVRATRGIGS